MAVWKGNHSMNKDCIKKTKSYQSIEDGVQIVYLKLFFDPVKCSQCNWRDGWQSDYRHGNHPCRVMLLQHPNYYDSAVENSDFFNQV